MGRIHNYDCECGFRVGLVLGFGWNVGTDAFLCQQCETIVSAVVMNLKNLKAEDVSSAMVTPRCQTDAAHTLVLWNLDDRICPKCGRRMSEISGGFWD